MLGVGLLTLFPAFAAVVLRSPTTGYTLINVANGLGGILGGFIIGALSLRLGLGRLIALMALLTATGMGLLAGALTTVSAALVAFGFGLVLVMLFVGASTLIQTEVPNEFRGRVLALYSLAFSGLTPFGALALGLVSANVGVLNAFLFSAGLSGLLTLGVLARWPSLWRRPRMAQPALRSAALAEKQM